MEQYILVLNCGSSSIKFAVIDLTSEQTQLSGLVERIHSADTVLHWKSPEESAQQAIPQANYQQALLAILGVLQQQQLEQRIIGVGHRVVHGGERFTHSTLITPDVLQQIEACSTLAPLHNPSNLQGIIAAQKAFPQLPQVAVFDTAFHQTMPQKAYLYALPQQLYHEHAVRRYGFHGISYRYVAAQALQKLQLPQQSGLVIAHLGNGCSVTALLNGQSIDTSMGMTPLEGLIMGTRSGDLDPGLHGYLASKCGYRIEKITELFNKQSGLLGISGYSMDMRSLQQAAETGNAAAQLAIEMFCYRLAKYIGALATTLPRLDALIFTGGIGENAAPVRAKVLQQLAVLNFKLADAHNQEHGRHNNGIITQEGSTLAMVIPTNEELMIAQDVQQILTEGAS